MNDRERIQEECNRVLDAFMDALNAYDAAGMDSCMHFPHPRIAADKVVVYDKPGTNPMDLFERLKKEDGWSYSRWVKREVTQFNDRKAHVVLSYTRFRADGSVMGTYESLYVLTKVDGRWGIQAIQLRSLMSESPRPPFPPFDASTAAQKVRMAEDAWNMRDPVRVSLAYTPDSVWRNRSEFLSGREAIVQFLTRKWNKELEYRLIKELWAFHGNRIAVRFAYEWRDDSGHWFRSYGNENWEFNDQGFMQRRIASINDLPIQEKDRKYHWPLGRRPDDHPALSALGL